MPEWQRQIEDDRVVVGEELVVADRRVDECGGAVGGTAVLLVDVTEDVVFRLHSILDGVQQLRAAAQHSVHFAHSVEVAVA